MHSKIIQTESATRCSGQFYFTLFSSMDGDRAMTKQNKPSETKRNGSKPVETESLNFGVPLSKAEEIEMFTMYLREKRKMQVDTTGGQYKKGQLWIDALPEVAK